MAGKALGKGTASLKAGPSHDRILQVAREACPVTAAARAACRAGTRCPPCSAKEEPEWRGDAAL